jgi:hypothetical protein
LALFKSFKDTNNYIEIFKNPTSREIIDTYNKTKEISNYYYLRGVLKPNGDILIWPGCYLHLIIEKYTGIEGMKFTYNPKELEEKWEIELVDGRLEYKEIIEYLNKYIHVLKTIGDTEELNEYVQEM